MLGGSAAYQRRNKLGGFMSSEEFPDVHGYAMPIKPGGCGVVYGH